MKVIKMVSSWLLILAISFDLNYLMYAYRRKIFFNCNHLMAQEMYQDIFS